MWSTPDSLRLCRALAEQPYRFDFFQALRRIECLHAELPRIGSALKPRDEPLRLGQSAELSFAPAAIATFTLSDGGGAPRMAVRFFGLLGPNGPLPLHLTEYVRERELHEGDKTLVRFLDIFHHRLLTLFYRAWAQAQPVVNLDRPRQDRFALYIGAGFGIGTPRLQSHPPTFAAAKKAIDKAINNKTDNVTDEKLIAEKSSAIAVSVDATANARINRAVASGAVADFAKLFFAGQLVRQVRNRDGLAALLDAYFRVPVCIEEFVGHWLQLPVRERTRLSTASAALGRGAVVGARVWDRQHKIRIRLGPLTLAQYESFLPGGSALFKLLIWLRQYLCFELAWDTRLVLAHDEVPQMQLGGYGRLGWSTWLGKRQSTVAAADLLLDPERLSNAAANI